MILRFVPALRSAIADQIIAAFDAGNRDLEVDDVCGDGSHVGS